MRPSSGCHVPNAHRLTEGVDVKSTFSSESSCNALKFLKRRFCPKLIEAMNLYRVTFYLHFRSYARTMLGNWMRWSKPTGTLRVRVLPTDIVEADMFFRLPEAFNQEACPVPRAWHYRSQE